VPAGEALARAGLEPIALGAKDGLAICSSSAVSSGAAALALVRAERLLAGAQGSAALAMEGFRANLSPIDPRVVAARPAPGQEWAAAGLRELLRGGSLTEPGAARRLQDPLSFRCASQVHGALRVALGQLADAIAPELNGAADNPLVLAAGDQILSTGNFHVPALALALDAAAIAVAQVGGPLCERPARLRTQRLSGLPDGLVGTGDGATRSGIAPLHKTSQSLLLELRHLAAPLAIHSMVGADGVEDDSTGAAQAALRLHDQLDRLALMIAVELVVAAQAVDLAAPARLGAGTAELQRRVRDLVAPLDDDRALGAEVERVARELVTVPVAAR
jgi:histidine ammonia-lyase